MKTLKCEYCKKEFKVMPYRENIAKFCSRSCFYKSRISRVEIKCDHCGNKFERRLCEIKKRKHNYCSRICYHRSMKGKKNPMHSKWMKKNSSLMHTKEAKIKISNSLRDRDFSESHRKKLSERALKLWENPKYAKRQRRLMIEGLKNKKPTKPERKLIEIIEKYDLPYRYVGDGKIIIGKLNPDFINYNGSKKVIEVFGDYWHNTDKIDIQWFRQEWGRQAYFSQVGYDCLVLWECELKELSDNEIINKIKNFDLE